ncbi:hypothetical protein [Subtercola endophyticus]|uniref:hypothetical protein n=1 Tax=Subtercola endophyticus TaxID=2895559 RepID=UPI001E5A1584|nr:hypothetical protein [Subtercola endophyticus]UFS57995.1 hypothetical protein LQ955_13300 [Subtercola endophyticus]
MSMTPPEVPASAGASVPAPVVTGDEATGILQLMQHDSDVDAALRLVYAGRHDVADALWWRGHSLADSPSGVLDPAAERAVLQAEVFSRSGSDVSQAALLELEQQLSDDAAALDRAVQDARPQIDAASARAARREAEAHRAVEAGARPSAQASQIAAADDDLPLDDPDGDEDAARGTVARWRRRSQVWMWTAIACGVLLLAGVGLVVAQQLAPQGSAGFALLPGAAGTGIPTPSQTIAGATRGLTIFSDPSLAPSIPPANIDPYYQPDSLRLLGVANSFLTVYAVENRINQPCLLAVYTDGTQSATCVTTEEFTSMGIELRITSLQLNDGSASFPDRSVSQDVVFWNPDGSYGVSSSARTAPAG